MDFFSFISEYAYAFSFYGFLLALVSFFLVIWNVVKTAGTMRKYKRLMRGVDNKNLEALLEHYLSSIKTAVSKIDDMNSRQLELATQVNKCVQGVGVVRYNPFEEMGSDLSFSIALIDSQRDGVVITGIFSRQSSSTYAKMLSKGKSAYHLSDEEQQALRKAVESLSKQD